MLITASIGMGLNLINVFVLTGLSQPTPIEIPDEPENEPLDS